MFDSPISKTQAQLVSAARAAASDYIQNGTDLTEAVVKSASALQPITSEHVRRICEMTYHDAYERLFAEKTGMLQYVSFDPPDAIRAAELLDALQLGVNQQHNFDKLASKTMRRTTRQRLMSKQASAALGGSIGAGIGAIGGAMSGDQNSTTRQRLGRAVAGGALGGILGTGAGKLMSTTNEVKNLQKVVDSKQKEVANAEQAASKAVQQSDALAAETSRLKNVAQENLNDLSKKIDAENIEKATADLPNLEYQVQRRTMNLRDAKQRVIDAGLEGRSSSDPDSLLGTMPSGARYILEQAEKAPKELEEAEAALAAARKIIGGQMKKEAGVSMPRKFQRMNTHELWTKAASGKELQDHNPTRSVQQIHRDLKDSVSTVKSELYAAEHNEKLAMIDMVKQAKAGLSAGHSMEQVLHAAVSVVDATEPFMAKTAHDLCAIIVEACADHQNSGFRKEAQIFMSPQEAIKRGRENDKAGKSVLGKMMGNRKKEAGALQEVNPNHPIPQKFKKLAEANIQRKHLEVTLDELNRNMDYFNEQLKNELFR